MIATTKETRKVNSFEYVAIPTLRDLFNRYGARIGSEGAYTAVPGEFSEPQLVSATSTIEQMRRAQRLLEKETNK